MQLKTKLVGSGALLLALGGIGGATALAQASGAATPPAVHAPVVKTTTLEPVNNTDNDNVQEGDQTTPDIAATKTGAKTATPAESESTSESETGPSDGPGGHEDPPGNVDNQQTGEN